MHRFPLLLLVLCSVLTAAADDATRKIAYERGGKIYVANLDGTVAKKVGEGVFPDISADAKHVTFNTQEQNGANFARHIAVVDLATGEKTIFKDVPSENVAYPKWSPDGTQIVFTLNDGKNWHLAMTKADGSEFHYVKKSSGVADELNCPCWAPDGKSIFVQDIKNIRRLGLDGSEIAHWEVGKTIPNGEMSGNCRIDVSPDGQKLLLGIDMNEDAHRKTWDGPLPAVWTLDLASKKATRITQKKLFGWDGCWIDDASIFFLSQGPTERTASLYRMELASGTPSKAIAKDVSQPTVSR